MAANNTAENVKKSMTYLYSDLLKEREREREEKRERKRIKEEEREAARLGSDEDPKEAMSKKDKREASIASWEDIIVGLTGEDLEYIPEKKNKKKYKKWIGEEDSAVLLTAKPKKKKKRNYQKEFDPELNMLKTIVSEQKKFTDDLQKRYQIAAGPNTKDAMPLNKTLVELASVINASRGNSLGILKEISGVKKTIADLYMKQKKLESELGGSGFNGSDGDMGLMGSDIFASLAPPMTALHNAQAAMNNDAAVLNGTVSPQTSQTVPSSSSYMPPQPKMVFPTIQKMDPKTWDGGGADVGATAFEKIDKTIVVEWHKDKQQGRFKAIHNGTGEEIFGCPVPESTVKSIDEEAMIAKDDFDQIYKLEIVS